MNSVLGLSAGAARQVSGIAASGRTLLVLLALSCACSLSAAVILDVVGPAPAAEAASAATRSAVSATVSAQGSPLLRLPEHECLPLLHARFAASPVAWRAGSATLGACIALLSAGGNAVLLAPGVDAQRRLDLPAFSGDFWTALLLLAERADLAPLPGTPIAPHEEVQTRSTAPLLTGGPVVLAPQASVAYRARSPAGPILVETQRFDLRVVRSSPADAAMDAAGAPARRLDLVPVFRLEPRVDFDLVGGASIEWTALVDRQGRDIPRDDSPHPAQLTASDVSADLGLLRPSGRLQIHACAAFTATGSIAVGTVLPVLAGSADLELSLALQGTIGALRCDYPGGQLLGVPRLELRRNGALLRQISSTAQGPQSEGRSQRLMRYQGVGDEAHEVRIDGRVRLHTVTLPIRATFALPGFAESGALGATSAAAPRSELAPTRLRHAGGDLSLGQAVELLTVGGHTVAVELGTRLDRRAQVPPLEGTWWQAALALATAFDLSLRPPQGDPASDTGLATGTLNFGPARSGDVLPHEACAAGPLLLEVLKVQLSERRGLDGRDRDVQVTFRLRLEPGADPERVAAITVVGSASDRDSGTLLRQLRIEDPSAGSSRRASNVRRVVRRGRPMSSDGQIVMTFTGLPEETRRVQLSGLLTLDLQQRLRGEASLIYGGQPTGVAFGDRTLAIALLDPDQTALEGWHLSEPRSMLRLSDATDLGNLMVELTDGDGNRTPCSRTNSTQRGQALIEFWQTQITTSGTYRVTITGHEARPSLTCGFSIEVTLP